MDTPIKSDTSSAFCFGLTDLENGAEIQALIDKVQNALPPCGRCGTPNGHVTYYHTPDTEAPHHFRIQCFGEGCCLMQTPGDSALDTEKSIKDALHYVWMIWTRSKGGDPYPPPPIYD